MNGQPHEYIKEIHSTQQSSPQSFPETQAVCFDYFSPLNFSESLFNMISINKIIMEARIREQQHLLSSWLLKPLGAGSGPWRLRSRWNELRGKKTVLALAACTWRQQSRFRKDRVPSERYELIQKTCMKSCGLLCFESALRAKRTVVWRKESG